jgi:hypothetical protein
MSFQGVGIYCPFQNEKADSQDIDEISAHAGPLLKSADAAILTFAFREFAAR